MTYDPRHRNDTFQQARLKFIQGEYTPREHLEAKLAAMAEFAHISAFADVDLAAARRAADATTTRYKEGHAKGPLDGLVLGVKDLIDTADLLTEMGSPIFKANRPRVDAPCVTAVREGGAVIVGKTVTTQFAVGGPSVTSNPHDATRSPGGSSAGAGAAVGANILDASLATQSQGSILRPASYCGAVGYKPSFGALSLAGIHPVAPSQDHLGVISDTVDTAWEVSRWIAGNTIYPIPATYLHGPELLAEVNLTSIRVGVLQTEHFSELDEQSLNAFHECVAALSRAGARVVAGKDQQLVANVCRTLVDVPENSRRTLAYEMGYPFVQYAANFGELLEPRVKEWVADAKAMPHSAYAEVCAHRSKAREAWTRLQAVFDVVVLPASSGAAPLKSTTGSRTLQTYATHLGLPACSLPVMAVDGMPFGLQLIGFHGYDFQMLSAAKVLMNAALQRA